MGEDIDELIKEDITVIAYKCYSKSESLHRMSVEPDSVMKRSEVLAASGVSYITSYYL